jgi:beta-lactamase regulating signal transducer with metallopeptidase domain
MMAKWMYYSLIVSALFTLTAFAGERIAALIGLARRWVWTAVVGASAVLPVIAILRPALEGRFATAPQASVSMSMPSAVAFIFPSPATIDDVSRFDVPLAIVWSGTSALMLLSLVLNWLRLSRMRRKWRQATIDGRSVLVANNLGPAAVGARTPVVVVPEWVLNTPERLREIVLLHEHEHVAARDPALLMVCGLATVLMPWNPFSWWQQRRLRNAVEIDCDRRVLSTFGEPHVYAEGLLTLSRGPVMPAIGIGFSYKTSLIEQRIRAMIKQNTKWRVARIGGLAVLALIASIGACAIDSPQSPLKTSARPSEMTAEEFNAIEPVDLESIEVIKGPSAVELYGDRARDGVIVVKTKKGATRLLWPAPGQDELGKRIRLRGINFGERTERKRSDLLRGRIATGRSRTGINQVQPMEATSPYLDFQVEKNAQLLPNQEGPRYPEVLRTAGLEGQVDAQFVVDTSGAVDINTFKCMNTEANPLFVSAVKDVLTRLRFAPAEVGGKKVRELVQQSFYFNINKK